MVDGIYDMGLMNEMVQYAKATSLELLAFKALRISNLCYKRGHQKLADAIDKKYSRHYPKSDREVALSMALMVHKK